MQELFNQDRFQPDLYTDEQICDAAQYALHFVGFSRHGLRYLRYFVNDRRSHLPLLPQERNTLTEITALGHWMIGGEANPEHIFKETLTTEKNAYLGLAGFMDDQIERGLVGDLPHPRVWRQELIELGVLKEIKI